MTSSARDWLISVDDHVIEPPGVWRDRVPSRLRDAARTFVADDDGEAWLWEGQRFPTTGLFATAGKRVEEFSPAPVTFSEMRAGCYDPIARAEDMDRDGVLASLVFPTFPRFGGPLFSECRDRDLGLACIVAYNDWMIDEWCGSAPGRYIPMIIVPLWDGDLAASEVLRCAAKGAKAITFPENPSPLGFPSLHDATGHWDPLWSAASECGMPICAHVGSSSQQIPPTAPDAPLLMTAVLTVMNANLSLSDWLYSGIFVRFPQLKLCLSEGGIGWIPYMLERLDYTVERQGSWALGAGDFDAVASSGPSTIDQRDVERFSVLPSEQFRNNVYGCFIDDVFGSRHASEIGIENIMIETDYPHSASSWPHSLETAHRRLNHLSEGEKYLVLQGNARRVFQLDPKLPRHL